MRKPVLSRGNSANIVSQEADKLLQSQAGSLAVVVGELARNAIQCIVNDTDEHLQKLQSCLSGAGYQLDLQTLKSRLLRHDDNATWLNQLMTR